SRKPVLKCAERTELFPECTGECTGWFSAAISTQNRPKEAMVGVTTAVVTYRIAGFFGYLADIPQQVLNGLLSYRGSHTGSTQSCVQPINITTMMLCVVQLQGTRVEVRFERVVSVRQVGKAVGAHGPLPELGLS